MCAFVYEVNTLQPCHGCLLGLPWHAAPNFVPAANDPHSIIPSPPSSPPHTSTWRTFSPLPPSGYFKYSVQHAWIDPGAHHWCCRTEPMDVLLPWEKSPNFPIPGELGWGGSQKEMQKSQDVSCCWSILFCAERQLLCLLPPAKAVWIDTGCISKRAVFIHFLTLNSSPGRSCCRNSHGN